MAFFEFPHTRTYDSDLAWLIRAYKILTGKVNNIEQTIEDTINEALQGEELKQLITQMIAEALPLNVKYPPAESGLTPAVGDGETDDTAALQAMIAYANAHNMPMIFPAGVYRVTGRYVNVATVFEGFDATLMLAPVSAKPLITLTADLATSGLTLNGNLGGQTTAQNVINIVNGSFAITNTTIMGGKSCIEGTLVGDSIIGDSYLRNFQEYGIHAEGNGSFTASNVVVPSVASGGAMRFMRIDCDNCTVSNFSSQAAILIGFEITGDNNSISANIPNAETPVNDSGTGNTWTITGKDEKRYFEGSGALSYQSLQETVEGDYTQTVGDFEGTASGGYSFNSEEFVINSSNPLTYKTPQTLNPKYNYVPAKDRSGENYKIVVSKRDSYDYINVCDFGVVGDGETDNSEALAELLNNPEYAEHTFFFPDGQYRIESTVRIDQAISIQGTSPLTCLLFTPNPTTILHFNCSAAQTYYSYFGGFALVYTGTGGNTGSQGILVDGNMYFNFNVFENIMFRGLEVGFNNSKINTGNREIAFDFNQFVNVRATNEGANTTSYGIRFFTGSGTGNSFVQCDFICSKAGISWTTQSSYIANIGDILISSCHFGGTGSTGIDIYGGNAAYHARCSITNCQFDAGVAHGVTISTFDNLFISNCEFGGNVDYQLNNVSLMQFEYNSLESEFAGYKNTTGASSVAIGTINIQSSSCLLEVFVAGDISGAGDRSAYGKWLACSPAELKEIDNVNMDDYLKVVATKLNNDISISASMTGGTTTGRIYFTVKVTSPKFIPNLLSDT